MIDLGLYQKILKAGWLEGVSEANMKLVDLSEEFERCHRLWIRPLWPCRLKKCLRKLRNFSGTTISLRNEILLI